MMTGNERDEPGGTTADEPEVEESSVGKRAIDPSTLALAYALSEGSAEALVLIDPAGCPHFIRGGEPIVTLLGVRLDGLAAGWSELLGEHDLAMLTRTYQRVVRTPGESGHATVTLLPADRPAMSLEVSLSNQLHNRAVRALVLRVREADPHHTRPPDSIEQPLSAGPVTAARFAELLQGAIDKKEQKIWSRQRFARSAIKDRRYDYSVVSIELAQLRAIRDGLGADVVERVVTRVTDQLSAVLRGRDVLAHLGSGQYAILLDGVGDVQHAERVTDVIMRILDKRIEVAGHRVTTAPAVGIATSERRYERAEEVMRDASSATARAGRRRLKRRVAFHSEMRVEDQRRIALMADLHDALDRGELYLCYQPIVSLDDSALMGFEALARWRHPKHGLIPPATFIPLAEETGFISALGRWVMHTACGQMAVWQAAHARVPLIMSVNLSASQLTDGSVLSDVEAALANTGLEPGCLNLELTESVVLEQTDSAADAVAKLKLYGVKFSLDDFGTGYSSLSYLHRLEYDELKIDRSFVGQTVGQRKVVQAIVTLAHALGMRVVAEGVESEQELTALRELGCDAAQGYYFARPLSADDAEEVIRAGLRIGRA